MLETQFEFLIVAVLFSAIMLVAGLYLLANHDNLFRNRIKNELIRQNIVVWMIGVCLILALTPTNPDFFANTSARNLKKYFLVQLSGVTVIVLFVFNITRAVSRLAWVRKQSFVTRMLVILLTIIICAVAIGIPVNYVANGKTFRNVQFAILFNFYSGCITGLIYITTKYLEIERQKKLNEKELELSRLRELKTKAELDALHSKINPHFLYNALNSIADLSVTDGKKARKMTVALADLFRYSINYSDNNFSPIKEELEMAEVYLQIEKIRFEDKLNYSVSADEVLNNVLVPRFLLQPIVENAVKHGLKSTGKLTEIHIDVKPTVEGFEIAVSDNGPLFPEELLPGYGVKSIYDKLDLLFPGMYEVHFINSPRKQVSIKIMKRIKNETYV
jgi:two-component system, LytTR family, sensor kinase